MLESGAIRSYGTVVAAAALMTGCHAPLPHGREHVSAGIECRAGAGLGPPACPGEILLPPEMDLADGVAEDEAMAAALWNNAAYQALLTELGISRAQLLEAGLLTDPSLQAILPAGPKQWEYTLFLPLEVLWLRPERLRAAGSEVDRSIAGLVQRGLDLIRDVRLAHADLILAQQRAELATEAHSLREAIDNLADRRLQAGDISQLEATSTEVERLQALAEADRAQLDVALAEARLKELLGLALWPIELHAVESPLPSPAEQPVDELVSAAVASRPDVVAAGLLVEAARRRAKLARCRFFSVSALVDANEQGSDGSEVGPGLNFTIPIFNANRGGIALADAQLEQAGRQRVALEQQAAREVQTAFAQAAQARQNLEAVQSSIVPALERAVELATRNYEQGGAAYFLVLQTTAQFLDSRAREQQLAADLRRAAAELDRSVGRAAVPIRRTEPVEVQTVSNVILSDSTIDDNFFASELTPDDPAPHSGHVDFGPAAERLRPCRPLGR